MQDELISRQAVLDLAKKGVLISNGSYKSVCKAINEIPADDPQNCDNCEVGNPCLYCRHEFEPQESNDKCKNCEYYLNPDYTRCHECKAERSDGKK